MSNDLLETGTAPWPVGLSESTVSTPEPAAAGSEGTSKLERREKSTRGYIKMYWVFFYLSAVGGDS